MQDPQDERKPSSLARTLLIGLWVAVMAVCAGGELVRETGADVAVDEFLGHACSGDLFRPAQAPAADV